MERKVARGTMYLMLAQFVFLVCGYGVHVGLARFLGPALYGMYGVVMSLLLWFEIAVINGISTATKKYIAENPADLPVIQSDALRIQLVYSLIVFGLVGVTAGFIARMLDDNRITFLLSLAAIDIPFYGIFSVYQAIVNGMRDFKKQAIIISLYSLTKVSAMLLFVLFGFSLSGALVGNICASLVGLLMLMFFCRKYQKNVPRQSVKGISFKRKLIMFAIPVILFALARQLLINLDLLCVKAFIHDDIQVGFYTAAAALGKTPYFIFLGLFYTLFPSLARSIAEHDKEKSALYIRQSLRLVAFCTIPFIFLIIPTAEHLITLAFSSIYSPAASALSILIVGITFFTFFMILSMAMVAANKPYHMFSITLGVITVAIFLQHEFIPRYGISGAAWATTISTFTGMLVVACIVYARFKVLIDFRSFFKIITGSVAIYVIARVYHASGIFLLVEYGVLFIVYAGLLFIMKELTVEDLKLLLWSRAQSPEARAQKEKTNEKF